MYRSALALIVVTLIAGSAPARICVSDDTQIEQLLERLESAEARIAELQEEVSASQDRTTSPIQTDPVFFQDDSDTTSLSDQLHEILIQNEKLQAEHEDLEKKYESLSKSHQKLATEYDKFKSDIGKGKGIVVPGDPAVTIKINGRVHADYWAFPSSNAGSDVLEGTPAAPMDPEDRFGLRRVRFTLRGDIADNMFYRFDVEMANPHNFEWRDAYLGFKNLPANQELVIGHQKRPYGWDTLNNSNYNIFLERPMVSDFMNVDYRRLGIMVNGVTDDESWNWHYGVFGGADIQSTNSFSVGDQLQLEVAGRLANTWWYDEESKGRGWGHWAIAGSVSRPDGRHANNIANYSTRPEGRTTDRWINTRAIVGATTTELIALENAFNAGPFHAAGEVQSLFVQRDTGGDLTFWGAYGEAAYMLTGEHMQWNRKTGTLDGVVPFENFFLVDRMSGGTGAGWGAWQVAARYSYLDASTGDVLAGVGNSATLGLVWYFNSNAKLQLNYVHGWIGDSADLNTAGVGNAEYSILGARCLIAF